MIQLQTDPDLREGKTDVPTRRQSVGEKEVFIAQLFSYPSLLQMRWGLGIARRQLLYSAYLFKCNLIQTLPLEKHPDNISLNICVLGDPSSWHTKATTIQGLSVPFKSKEWGDDANCGCVPCKVFWEGMLGIIARHWERLQPTFPFMQDNIKHKKADHRRVQPQS